MLYNSDGAQALFGIIRFAPSFWDRVMSDDGPASLIQALTGPITKVITLRKRGDLSLGSGVSIQLDGPWSFKLPMLEARRSEYWGGETYSYRSVSEKKEIGQFSSMTCSSGFFLENFGTKLIEGIFNHQASLLVNANGLPTDLFSVKSFRRSSLNALNELKDTSRLGRSLTNSISVVNGKQLFSSTPLILLADGFPDDPFTKIEKGGLPTWANEHLGDLVVEQEARIRIALAKDAGVAVSDVSLPEIFGGDWDPIEFCCPHGWWAYDGSPFQFHISDVFAKASGGVEEWYLSYYNDFVLSYGGGASWSDLRRLTEDFIQNIHKLGFPVTGELKSSLDVPDVICAGTGGTVDQITLMVDATRYLLNGVAFTADMSGLKPNQLQRARIAVASLDGNPHSWPNEVWASLSINDKGNLVYTSGDLTLQLLTRDRNTGMSGRKFFRACAFIREEPDLWEGVLSYFLTLKRWTDALRFLPTWTGSAGVYELTEGHLGFQEKLSSLLGRKIGGVVVK